jgi:hypothetical protein
MNGLAAYPPFFNQLTCEYTVQTLAGDVSFTRSAGLLCTGTLCDVLNDIFPGWVRCNWNIKSYGWKGTLRFEPVRPIRKLTCMQ